jgi:hypothetical protein
LGSTSNVLGRALLKAKESNNQPNIEDFEDLQKVDLGSALS